MSGTWYVVPLKRVNSHSNAIDIQADVVHQRMLNLSYRAEREGDQRLMRYLLDHGTHRSTMNCKASQSSPYSHVEQPAFHIGLYSVWVTDWPGNQCTHHRYWGVSRMQHTTEIIRLKFTTFNLQHLAQSIVLESCLGFWAV